MISSSGSLTDCQRGVTTKELWKEVPGFLGYEVSNQGQVRSYLRRVGLAKWEIAENPQRILCPSLSRGSKGYRLVGLRKNGKTHRRRIGRLVLLAFVGLPPDGMEMCHNDGNSYNDRLGNLRYDTRAANMQDASRHGVLAGGKPRLGPGEARIIRVKFAISGYSRKELAREFGVSPSVISNVLRGEGAYGGGSGPIQPRAHLRLSDQQVMAIREKRALGGSVAGLAEEYGVSKSMISRIASGKRRTKVAGPRTQPWEIHLRRRRVPRPS